MQRLPGRFVVEDGQPSSSRSQSPGKPSLDEPREAQTPIDSHPVILSAESLTEDISPTGTCLTAAVPFKLTLTSKVCAEFIFAFSTLLTSFVPCLGSGLGQPERDDGDTKPTKDRSTDFVIESSCYAFGNSREGYAGDITADGEVRRSDEEAGDVAVIDVTERRDVFNYLTLCSDMVQDHLPDQYTKAVALILSQTKSSR